MKYVWYLFSMLLAFRSAWIAIAAWRLPTSFPEYASELHDTQRGLYSMALAMAIAAFCAFGLGLSAKSDRSNNYFG